MLLLAKKLSFPEIFSEIYNCSIFRIYNLYFFSLFLKGKPLQEAQEVVNDIVTGPNGKTLLIVAVVFVIGGIFIVGSIVNNGYEPPSNPSMRNDRTPLNCARMGHWWSFWRSKMCLY